MRAMVLVGMQCGQRGDEDGGLKIWERMKVARVGRGADGFWEGLRES